MEPTLTPIATNTSNASYGIEHFWQQSDGVIHSVAILLLIMSVLSWAQILLKSARLLRRNKTRKAVEQFWQAGSVEEALNKLEHTDVSSPYVDMAKQATLAASQFDVLYEKTLGGADRSEFLTRALRQSIVRSTSKLESGLTLLASIGSVAPFVGLFGTVWGIYHALLLIASTGSASIDKVSGPVGEALIMTAAGLFVAIPAVLAYNTFNRLNRVELAELDGFAHDLHAYLNTGVKISSRPAIRVVEKGV